jgi:hypothetical protein
MRKTEGGMGVRRWRGASSVALADSAPDEFASGFEAAFARLQVALLEGCALEQSWAEKIAAGVRAGLDFAAADTTSARQLTSEALAHGRDGVARHDRLLAYLAERLRQGRAQSVDGERLPEITERAMAGGAVALVAQRIDQGKAEELPALEQQLSLGRFPLRPYRSPRPEPWPAFALSRRPSHPR